MKLVGIPYTRRRSSVVWAIGFFAASITPEKWGRGQSLLRQP